MATARTRPTPRPACPPAGALPSAHEGPVRRTDPDRGGALPLVAGVLALAVVVLLGVMALGGLAADRARAQTAADAAALAGAAEGRSAAEEEAERNRGELVSWGERGDEVEVVVEVGDARATARARRSW